MPDETPPQSPTLRFDYLKSAYFRVVHADGVLGGATPKGALMLSFWSERVPIPQQVTHRIEPAEKGRGVKLGPELVDQRVVRDAIVREVEVGVYMELDAAEALN